MKVTNHLARGSVVARQQLIPAERIERSIRLIRGQKVMLDSDLAALYGVETRALLQAVKRNRRRFPDDFVFQLAASEAEILRSQSVISSSGHGGRRTAPYAFTEQGVAMLSSVLRSKRAVQVNIAIMRAFVRLREDGRPQMNTDATRIESKRSVWLHALLRTSSSVFDPCSSVAQ